MHGVRLAAVAAPIAARTWRPAWSPLQRTRGNLIFPRRSAPGRPPLPLRSPVVRVPACTMSRGGQRDVDKDAAAAAEWHWRKSQEGVPLSPEEDLLPPPEMIETSVYEAMPPPLSSASPGLHEFKHASFPMCGVRGQDRAKTALIVASAGGAGSLLGGVLLAGPHGTGKTVLMRAMREILPPMDVVEGEPFNADPDRCAKHAKGHSARLKLKGRLCAPM